MILDNFIHQFYNTNDQSKPVIVQNDQFSTLALTQKPRKIKQSKEPSSINKAKTLDKDSILEESSRLETIDEQSLDSLKTQGL